MIEVIFVYKLLIVFSGRRGRRPLRGIFPPRLFGILPLIKMICVLNFHKANNICRGRRPRRPAFNDYSQINSLYVILSGVRST